jgi:hypothetical protein
MIDSNILIVNIKIPVRKNNDLLRSTEYTLIDNKQLYQGNRKTSFVPKIALIYGGYFRRIR